MARFFLSNVAFSAITSKLAKDLQDALVSARIEILPNPLSLRTGRHHCACSTTAMARRRTTR